MIIDLKFFFVKVDTIFSGCAHEISHAGVMLIFFSGEPVQKYVVSDPSYPY